MTHTPTRPNTDLSKSYWCVAWDDHHPDPFLASVRATYKVREEAEEWLEAQLKKSPWPLDNYIVWDSVSHETILERRGVKR